MLGVSSDVYCGAWRIQAMDSGPGLECREPGTLLRSGGEKEGGRTMDSQ